MARTFPKLLKRYYRLSAVFRVAPEDRSFWDRLMFRLAASGFESRVGKRYGASIPVAARIGDGAKFPHDFNGIHISWNAVIGSDCYIHQQVTIGADADGNAPIVGNRVLIGAGAKIIGNCRIGDGARIGANVVLVDADVPPGAVIVNNSAFDIANNCPVYPGYKREAASGREARVTAAIR